MENDTTNIVDAEPILAETKGEISSKKVRVVIIDDQTILRELLCTLLHREERFDIVGQAGEGREALEICLTKKPDLVILDLMLPGLNGVEVMRRLTKDLPDARVLAISGYTSERVVRDVLKAGAHGFIEKNAPIELLKQAIHQVASGSSYFGPSVATVLRAAVLKPISEDVELTDREREILQLVAEGHSTKEISAILNLSAKTVDNHRGNIMKKLDIHDIASLTRYAIKMGIISVP